MSKAPKMAEIQAALHQAEADEQAKDNGNVLVMPNLNIANFGEAFRYVMNVALNVLTVAAIVAAIVGLSVIGDRIYLSYTDTGSSKFEAFLKRQGYESEALAYKQQQQACADENGTLELCKGASWLYRHPEIAVWPSRSDAETAAATSPALAELPRR